MQVIPVYALKYQISLQTSQQIFAKIRTQLKIVPKFPHRNFFWHFSTSEDSFFCDRTNFEESSFWNAIMSTHKSNINIVTKEMSSIWKIGVSVWGGPVKAVRGVMGTAKRQMARSESAMLQMKMFVLLHISRFLLYRTYQMVLLVFWAHFFANHIGCIPCHKGCISNHNGCTWPQWLNLTTMVVPCNNGFI